MFFFSLENNRVRRMIQEKEIIKGCVAGKKEYQEILYQRYCNVLMGICRRYALNSYDAEDLLHDAFVRILTHINQYRFNGSFEGWLKRITTNVAIDYCKMKLKEQKLCEIDDNKMFDTDCMMVPEQAESVPMNILLQFIDELPVGYKTIFNLSEIDGLKKVEIAKQLNLSDGTVRSQLFKAKDALRKKINEYLSSDL